MPILIAIFFGIGLLLMQDTSKLPWFLQIIRAGLIVSLKWIFRLSLVIVAIWICVYFYGEYEKRKEETQWVTDYINKSKLDTNVTKKDSSVIKTEEEATEKDDKETYSTILGSWSRADKKFITKTDIGIFTFKANKTFFTSFSDNGTYKLSPENNTLYIYYDSGKAESFNMKVYNENEISGKLLQDEDIETFFLKRPRTEKEPSSESKNN